MGRMMGIFFGLGTHVFFGITVCLLFWFLSGGAAEGDAVLLRDCLLALQFGLVHSFILLPATRCRLQAWIPAGLYGCFFCAMTCLSLLLAITAWRASPVVLWSLAGWERMIVQAAFAASWVGLLYSLSLTGLGYQTGWTQFRSWLLRQPLPRRDFVPRGAYHFLRHPVYLSFLGLVWFTPRMTLDHAALTGIWTVYIFYGSYLKDRRLEHYLGDSYRIYQSQVPGYPLVPCGPLGKVRLAGEADRVQATASAESRNRQESKTRAA